MMSIYKNDCPTCSIADQLVMLSVDKWTVLPHHLPHRQWLCVSSNLIMVRCYQCAEIMWLNPGKPVPFEDRDGDPYCSITCIHQANVDDEDR